MPEKTPKRWRYRCMVNARLLVSSISVLNVQSKVINETGRDAPGKEVLSLDLARHSHRLTLKLF
jgi:hypothetical protein